LRERFLINNNSNGDIPNYVFLSYAGPNHKIAKALGDNINNLLSSSFHCELVEDREESDTTFTEKVISYVRKCNTFIVLVTKDSLQNQFVNHEWGYAKCLKEFGQIQLLIHVTEISEDNIRIKSNGFFANNMDFIDLKLLATGRYLSNEMILNVVKFLKDKSDNLLPVYTEKAEKLFRFCKEILWNIKLAERIASQEKSLREYLGFDVLPFIYTVLSNCA
jgi:TIR domain